MTRVCCDPISRQYRVFIHFSASVQYWALSVQIMPFFYFKMQLNNFSLLSAIFLYKVRLTARYFNRQIVASMMLIVMGVCQLVIPRMHTTALLYLVSTGVGFGAGHWNAAATTWIMEMWSGKILGAVLQVQQVVYKLYRVPSNSHLE